MFIDLSNNGQLAATSDSLGTASQTTSMQVSYLQQGAAGAPSMQTQTITVGAGTQYANTVGDMINAINNSGLGLTASLGTAQQAGTAAVAAALSSNQGGGSALDTGIMISGVGVGTGTNAVGEIGKLTVAAVNGDTLGGSLSIVGADGQTHNIALGTAGSTDTLTNLAATINNAGYGLTAKVNTAADANGNGAGTVLSFTTASAGVSVNGTGVTSTVAATTPNTVTFAADTTGSATVLGTMELNDGADTVIAGLGTLAGTDHTGAALDFTGVATLFGIGRKTDGRWQLCDLSFREHADDLQRRELERQQLSERQHHDEHLGGGGLQRISGRCTYGRSAILQQGGHSIRNGLQQRHHRRRHIDHRWQDADDHQRRRLAGNSGIDHQCR